MSGTVDDLIPFVETAELATLSARLPAIFLVDSKASERFWEFFAPTFATGTCGGPITGRPDTFVLPNTRLVGTARRPEPVLVPVGQKERSHTSETQSYSSASAPAEHREESTRELRCSVPWEYNRHYKWGAIRRIVMGRSNHEFLD
jgi:hypothetical protein